jgi:branched-subunit amino acid aminotransferase/4-amino-4-deoxychorismate lyase
MGIRINVNGTSGGEDDLLLSPLDQGFVFGASVYETIRTYNGRPFLLERHLSRLRESAASLRISLDIGDEEIIRRIEETLVAASNPESYIRLIVSAGVGELDYGVGGGQARQPTIVVVATPLILEPSQQHVCDAGSPVSGC